MSKEVTKYTKIADKARSDFDKKRKRAFVRSARVAAEYEPGLCDDVARSFGATGSHATSLRGRVSHFLLSCECGEHSVANIVRGVIAKGGATYPGKLGKVGQVSDATVKAALSHIYRRAKYNAGGVGYRIAPHATDADVVVVSLVSSPVHKTHAALDAPPATVSPVPALPAPSAE